MLGVRKVCLPEMEEILRLNLLPHLVEIGLVKGKASSGTRRQSHPQRRTKHINMNALLPSVRCIIHVA